jgi:antitoxin YobK
MPEPDPLTAAIGELVVDEAGVLLECSGPATEDEIAAAEKELGVQFPRSYRAFLRQFGAGYLNAYDIFGLPGDRLWGDVVMMNQIAANPWPRHLVKFTDDVGDYSFYLDTSRRDGAGECPVAVFGPGEDGSVVAESFLDFLQKAREGLV